MSQHGNSIKLRFLLKTRRPLKDKNQDAVLRITKVREEESGMILSTRQDNINMIRLKQVKAFLIPYKADRKSFDSKQCEY